MIKLLAHRGSPEKEAENTMVSFKRAIRENADWIEFDVRKGKKKHLFVVHDDNLQRIAGQDVSLKRANFTTVRNIKVGSKGERIPLLEEVLLLAKDTEIMLNIELKEKHLEREIVDMVEHYEMSKQIIISSFFYLPLLVLADYRPKLKTALLIDEPPEDLKARLTETGVNYIHPNIDFLNDETVKIARSLRKKINPFTVNTKKELKKALQYKINGIFTNKVIYMRKLMKELDVG
ncbi:MAG: glycerophosphodiester phosphodiesterase family protein [Desulfotalea sp.]